MIDTSNESLINIWLTDKASFEIWFGKIGEIEILKNDSNFIFFADYSCFFSWMWWIRLMSFEGKVSKYFEISF